MTTITDESIFNGFFRVFVEGQPDSIVEDIENMVRSYVEKVRELLLNVFLAKYVCARM